MMKKIISTSLFTLSFSISFSQSLVEKELIVKEVFEKIYSNSGVQIEAPTIKIKGNSVAMYYPDSKRIEISEAAYDFCNEYGERKLDALAFLLSHETGHHFTHDFWDSDNYHDFKITLADSLLIKKYGLFSTSNQDSILNVIKEIKADEKGSVLRYLGGFSSENLSEKFLRDIYQRFELKTICYPPLEQRIKIAHIGDSLAQVYLKVYEVSTFALMIKEYDLAKKGFDYLIRDQSFQSREIYNNLGVLSYLQAMALLDNKDDEKVKFLYPVEIDLESRIQGRGNSKGFSEFELLMIEAIKYFDQAINFDEEYSSAYLNRACIRRILKSLNCSDNKYNDYYNEAKVDCQKAIDFSKNNSEKQNAELVLALISLQDGNKKAKSIISKLAKKGNYFAAINHDIIKNNKIFSSVTYTQPLLFPRSKKSNTEYNEVAAKTRTYISKIQNYDNASVLKEESIFIKNTRFDTYFLSDSKIHVVSTASKNFLFHLTGNKYEGTTSQGLKIGESLQTLHEKHGLPQLVIASPQGYIYCYENGSNESKLFIVIDANNTVCRWIIVQDY